MLYIVRVEEIDETERRAVRRRHLICRDRLYLTATAHPQFESGFWDIPEAQARALVGGMLYLHQTKAERSYFGGQVLRYRVAGPDEVMPGRIVFTALSQQEGKDMAWEGASHGMAWDSGHLE